MKTSNTLVTWLLKIPDGHTIELRKKIELKSGPFFSNISREANMRYSAKYLIIPGSSTKVFILLLIFFNISFIHASKWSSVKGNGVLAKEKKTLSQFSSINAGGAYQIEIKCNAKQKVELSGDSNLLPLVKIEVEKGVLMISNERSILPKLPLIINLSCKDIKKLYLHGASKTRFFSLHNEKLEVVLNGAGTLEGEGKTTELLLTSSGAARISLQNLLSKKAHITLQGASKASVFANEELNVTIYGVGRVNYFGNPKKIQKRIYGPGKLINMSDKNEDDKTPAYNKYFPDFKF
ncbi:head GIN domain-containing protein [Candidatus Riflebacteria bacterium]